MSRILLDTPGTREIAAPDTPTPSRAQKGVQARAFADALTNAETAKAGTQPDGAAKPESARPASTARITPISRTPSQITGGLPPRAQAAANMTNTQLLNALELLSKSSSPADSTLDTLKNIVNTRSTLMALSGRFPSERGIAGRGAVRGSVTPPASAAKKTQAAPPAPAEVTGNLSAMFESGEDIAVIGYDSHGGTSYGKYQLSSRAGTMDQFIRYLGKQKSDWAKRLQAAGASNTGGKQGAMPRIWKQLAQENPELFESLQDRFVRDNHYKPALEALIRNTGINPDEMPSALQEVLFSTAVQHGPAGAARIFSRAVDRIRNDAATPAKNGKNKNTEAEQEKFAKSLIENVYALRSRQFGSSTSRVRSAVQSRLQEEKALALAMLNGDTSLA